MIQTSLLVDTGLGQTTSSIGASLLRVALLPLLLIAVVPITGGSAEFGIEDGGDSIVISISAAKRSEYMIVMRDNTGLVVVSLKSMIEEAQIRKNVPKALLTKSDSSYEVAVYERPYPDSTKAVKGELAIFELGRKWLVSFGVEADRKDP